MQMEPLLPDGGRLLACAARGGHTGSQAEGWLSEQEGSSWEYARTSGGLPAPRGQLPLFSQPPSVYFYFRLNLYVFRGLGFIRRWEGRENRPLLSVTAEWGHLHPRGALKGLEAFPGLKSCKWLSWDWK